MKVLITGSDGYIGYPLTIHLLEKGYEVFGVDNFSRRRRVSDIGSDSLTPITPALSRKHYLKSKFDNFDDQADIFLGADNPNFIKRIMNHVQPDAIIHLAEQPSAPWSMANTYRASETQFENVIGTLHLLWAMKEECPDAHLIKLGTMGEYGTPNCDIPEGMIPSQPCIHVDVYSEMITPEKVCPMSSLPFPRSPNSFYHLSKVHDTHNIIFACKTWNLRSTDIMQGIVFGLNKYIDSESLWRQPLNDEEITRFDYDEYFGTVINRFCVQAIIEHPLTVYGKGYQQRGFLPLKDSIQCLTIALENPPKFGEYRTLNQFENIYSINKLAQMVVEGARSINLNSGITSIENPRTEPEDHYYNPINRKLFDLGYKPTTDIQGEITNLIKSILPFKDRVKKEVILPKTKWR